MGNELKAVLFDLDGTILDTNELIIQSFLHALRGALPDGFGREQIIPHMGHTLVDQLKSFSGQEDVATFHAAYREYNDRMHDEMVSLFPGVANTVGQLRRHGIKLGVVTTKARRSTERALRLFGLLDLMDAVITLDDVEHAKPHPEPVLKALAIMDTEASQACMVGDSAVDMESALRAGAVPVGVAWSLKGEAVLRQAGAARVLASMEELLTLCGVRGAVD